MRDLGSSRKWRFKLRSCGLPPSSRDSIVPPPTSVGILPHSYTVSWRSKTGKSKDYDGLLKVIINAWLTNCTHQSHWEADMRQPSLESSRFLWNPYVHYRDNNSQSLDPILSQIYEYSVHNLICYFFKNLPPTRDLPSGLFPSVFRLKLSIHLLSHHLRYMPPPISSFFIWSI
jgi:hypothetical protein